MVMMSIAVDVKCQCHSVREMGGLDKCSSSNTRKRIGGVVGERKEREGRKKERRDKKEGRKKERDRGREMKRERERREKGE